MQSYCANQFDDKTAFVSVIEFLGKRKSMTAKDKCSYFNAMIWTDDIEGLNKYISSTGLSLTQNISLEFYLADRYLFLESDEKKCSDHLNYAKEYLEIYGGMPDSDDCLKSRYYTYLAFYEAYLAGNIESAVSAIADMNGGKLVTLWEKYHLSKCYEKIGDKKKTRSCKVYIMNQKGITRFHKWIGCECEDGAEYSVGMRILGLVSAVSFCVIVLVSGFIL
ncbi:MAG: hypothetical protein J5802_07615 [Butyrivibrio sp.]|nr:hypothetical protein [Butyrivibrio sp.]